MMRLVQLLSPLREGTFCVRTTRSPLNLIVSSDGRRAVSRAGSRLLADIDAAALTRLRSARAAAWEVAWLQAAETTGGIPGTCAGGRDLGGLVLDLDATLVARQLGEAAGHGHPPARLSTYHPLLCFQDDTGEALTGALSAGQRRRQHRRRPPCGAFRAVRHPTPHHPPAQEEGGSP